MSADTPVDTTPQTTRVGARWRIVWWILATTGLTLLVVIVSVRSILVQQVAEVANAEIVQEADEFRVFAATATDPVTHEPFGSASELLESYLTIQTPATGEVLIGVVGNEVLYVDNTSQDAGSALAADRERLDQILSDGASAGVMESPDGQVRWGQVTVTAIGDSGSQEEADLIIAHFTQADYEANDQEVLILMIVGVAGLVLAAGISWLAAGRILSPLRTMREVAESIGSHDLSGRVPVTGRDDISELAVTLNHMLDRVDRAHASQRHFVSEVRRRISGPQIRASQAVAQLAQEATSRRQRELAVGAGAELELMREVLDDLDILAQADTPDFVQPVYVSLREITAEAYSQAVTTTQGLQWTLNSQATGRGVLDRERVLQALAQLTENAATHTPVGSNAEIGSALSEDGATVSYWVANPDTDMDPEQAEALFELYRSETRDADTGMGLGLAVVRAVADAHHGSAWVEIDPQTGTRIGLDLPLNALTPVSGPGSGNTAVTRQEEL